MNFLKYIQNLCSANDPLVSTFGAGSTVKKILTSNNETIKVALSAELSNADFSLSEFEEIFDASDDIIQSNRNTLKKVQIGDIKTVIKSFKTPNKAQGFIYRYFRKSKARRSYEYSFLLSDLSINTPQPLGYIEVYKGLQLRQSYFISALLEYDFLIRDVLNNEIDNKTTLLKKFVSFTYHMHSKDILHLDYSTGNVCIKKVNDEYKFYLVDINRMKFAPVSTEKGIRNFSRMSASPKDIGFFSNEYSSLASAPYEVCQKNLSSAVSKEKNYRGRKRKLKQFFRDLKTVPESSYPWCDFSNQPQKIRDIKFKRKLYFLSLYPTIKVFMASILLPFFAFLLAFNKRVSMGGGFDGIGLCVNIDNPMPSKGRLKNEQLLEMVEELGVKNILVRIPLSDFENVECYFDFIESFSEKNILVNILQDRHHIDDLSLAKTRLREIFLRLNGRVKNFQIGNSVNRRKWAFISQDEYFNFFEVAQKLKKEEFNSINLLGSNIIDFELPFYIRSLFHCRAVFYNGVAAQLYVDRRGAPENKQFGFDTISKINFYSLIMRLSQKSDNKLNITEVNWPLEEMGLWAPAKGECMVSEALQAEYLVRYYLMAFASGRVDSCYWHQLVAPGYGLVNNLGEEVIKRDAYYCFKFLIKILDGGITRSYSEKNKLFRLAVETKQTYVHALWTNGDDIITKIDSRQSLMDMRGNPLLVNKDLNVRVSRSVIYLVKNK